MTQTIAGTYTTLVTLDAAIDNPTTITASGLLTDGLVGSYQGLAVVNAGGIAIAGTHAAVSFTAGGSVTNLSGGTISGYYGVYAAGAALTVVNAGTITGSSYAVKLATESANRLIADPGAVFTGKINGGTGVLELASAASAGTLTGIGTSFTDFSNVSINSGATWTLTGSNTIASGATLTDDGTLIDTGSISGGINLAANGALLSITSTGMVSNAATGSAVYSRYTVSVVNQGTIDVQAPGASVPGYYGIELANGGSIDNGGTITGNNFAGLRVLGGVSVTNSGLIASGRAGVFADFGVSIDNIGTIHGPINGVFARNGAAIITNSGTIYGNNAIWVLNGIGTVTNSGTLQGLSDRAVSLTAGGTVANQAGGLITAPDNNVAVYIGGANYTATASGVVTNAGTIAAGTGIAFYAGDTLSQTVIDSGAIIGSNGTAIAFSAGNDTLRLQSSTSVFIQGVVNGGGGTNTLAFASGATTGTLTGIGADFVNFTEATIDAGASWVLAGSDTFASSVTLINAGALTINGMLTNNGSFIVTGSVLNAGTIDGNPPGEIVVDMRAGSSLTNQAGGLIDGSGEGILLQSGGTVLNAGSIGGSGTGVYLAGGSLTNQSGGTISGYQGVDASGAAMVVNAGRISGDIDGPVGYAVVLLDGGRITNQAGGVINGYWGINAILNPVTVVNAGSIGGNMTGARGAGVFLFQGGAVTNQSGGVISGERGVVAFYAAATAVNAGTIDGNPSGGFGIALLAGGSVTNQSGGTISGGAGAVTLAAGHTNRVVIDPGALFIGAVDGGNTIGATAVSTLELAAAAGAGTLTGLGSQFIDFANITIDSGASWVLTGGNTIGAGVNLLDGGAVTVAGSLVNDGAATLSSSLVVTGTLRNLGSIDVASYRALELSSGGYLYNAAGATIARSSSGPVFDPTVFAMGGGAVAIRNLGTITDAPGDTTLYLRDGGTITNGSISDTTALIQGEVGLYIDTGRGIVTNFGTIETSADGGPGIELNQGGNIVNGASGSTAASILGVQYGVFGVDGPTTLTNFGTIAASDNGFGFYQRFGTATVFNAGVIAATDGSGVGIDLEGGGTVIDSGTVEGGNTAIRFGGTGSNLLVLENGYEFFGLIQGSASASNTLELVGNVDAPVTEKYLDQGVGLVNFQTVEFGPGAGNYATLGIRNDAELPATIAGFVGVHDTIDLTALSDTGNNASTSFNSLTDVLTVTGDNGSVQLHLDNNESYAGIDWVAQNDGNGGTAIQVVVPPVISGSMADQTTTDEATLSPFADVSISDVDVSQTETVTIALSNPANGTLSNLGGGSFDSSTGVYIVTGSDAAVTAALDGLVFTPTVHQAVPGSSVTTTFTIQATDTAGGTSTNNTTTVSATAVNDPPVITLPPGNTGVPNQTPYSPFTGLTVNDPDVGHVDTVTVTLSNPNGGVLSNLDGGSFDATTGVYSVTGTAADVTAALQGLVFTPTPPASDYVSTTSFTVAVTGPGGSATGSSVSVTSAQQVLGLSGAPDQQDVVSVSPDGSSFVAATPGKNNEAVVSDPSANASYTLPTGYQAEFLGGSADAMLTDPTGGNALLVGNSGNDTIVAGAANDTILGGSGNNTLSVGGANDLILATGGFSVIDVTGLNAGVLGGTGTISAAVSGNNATLSAGLSTASVTVSGSHAAIFGGAATNAGAFNVTDNGANTTIAAFAANASIATYGSDALIFGGTGTSNVTLSGASDTLAGGAGNETVSATGNALDFAGTGALNFVAGAGTATIVGNSGGPEQITAGSGGVLFAAQMNTAATITAGNGASTVFGGSGSVVTYVGSLAGATFVASQGNETLTAAASSTANFFSGGAYAGSNILMVGGSGADTMLAGLGSDTMTGGAGNNAFAFFAANTGGAHDIITDFNANDAVYLIGYDPAQTASTLQDAATVNASGVTLTLSDNTQITFTDLSNVQALDGHILYVGGTG